MGNVKINGITVWMDDYIVENVEGGKELIAANYDNVLCVDGMEGTGKSEFAFQWAIKQTEGKFSEKDVFYTANQFEDWIKQAKRGDVGVWDEFVLAGMSTDALTKMQNAIIKQFTIMRSKGLTVILVIPYFFMLRKYFAVARTRALIHIHSKGLERGHLKFYNYNEKHYIYNYGQKTWLYSPKIKGSFFATFRVWSDKFINHSKIAKLKEQALQEIGADKDKTDIVPTKKQAEAICGLNISQTFDHDSSPARLLREYRKKLQNFYWEKGKKD